ncbi:MAG: site-specific DNA-methyltransferase [Bacteroidales bacterium]|jgi:adenine-specific DNA-methyltransferase|nr:site-specific DNA-methyltransferase [Bacteroidales bacterium]
MPAKLLSSFAIYATLFWEGSQVKNLFDDLQSILKADDRFFSGEGNLLRNVVYSAAMQGDAGLLKLLLTHETTKKRFFTDVDGVLVFNQAEFTNFINNREFLPDSYTRFKNKIGLAKPNGDLLSATADVTLVFPYKDCVLEGGQTKEEQKRAEIFYNETLAPEEIDRLLYPKVLVNAKRYTKDGETIAKEVTDSDNLIIKGNNLLAISSLLEKYRGKIKCIYIDPPYNNGDNTFHYNDTFNHSSWLVFIKNRLELAKKLLCKNGVIFIHMGDSEMHYLKVLSDEIFGRDNFVATVPRKTRNGKSDVPYKMSQDYDWLLVYTNARSKDEKVFQRPVERKYYKTSDFPNDEWRLTDLTTQRSTEERPNSNFILVNPKTKEEFPANPARAWSVSKDTQYDFINKKKIVFPGDYDFLNITTPYMRVFRSEEIQEKGEDFDKTYVSTEFLNKMMDTLLTKTTNSKGTEDIIDLFGEKKFAYPKNELLLQAIIECCTKPNDIIVDFFGGSGTTAAVAHKLQRRYILIEQMGYINTITVERLKKVIQGDNAGISNAVGWKGGGSFVYCELAPCNQKYIDAAQSAKTGAELAQLVRLVIESDFITANVFTQTLRDSLNDFKTWTMEEKRDYILKLLDLNMLYVNLCDMNDEDFAISDADKLFTKSFYAGSKLAVEPRLKGDK